MKTTTAPFETNFQHLSSIFLTIKQYISTSRQCNQQRSMRYSWDPQLTGHNQLTRLAWIVLV